MRNAEAVRTKNRHHPKHILFFDKSGDGEVGGSHQCLLHIVRNLPEEYQSIVVFNSDNALRKAFERVCREVIVWKGPSATYFASLSARRGWNSQSKFRPSWLSRISNKVYKNANVILHDLGLGAIILMCYFYLLKRNRIDILHLNNWSRPILDYCREALPASGNCARTGNRPSPSKPPLALCGYSHLHLESRESIASAQRL